MTDSAPRRIIEYLRDNLPADLLETLHFDALTRRGDHLPMCVITPTPSLPELRSGGKIDVNTRDMKIVATLIWDASETGRNYDDFEYAVDSLVDTLYGLRGTDTLGSNILQSYCTLDDVSIDYDVETVTMVADIETNIKFVR